MVKIKMDVKSCKECPFFKRERMYTEDSWEESYNWFCTKCDDKKIAGYVGWMDDKNIKIPDWCPIRVDD